MTPKFFGPLHVHLTPISWSLLALLVPTAVLAEATQQYQIPAGPLDQALNQFAQQSGIEYYLDASLSDKRQSQGLQGSYQPEQALALLLLNTNITAEKQSNGVYYLSPKTNAMELDTIEVRTQFADAYQRDADGEMAVYDDDSATEYLSKDEVERFKGAGAADLFNSMSNVHSGEARNGGGAIDPNIRGVQGFGRVPVVIDGTEQGISVYNGYRGASSRSYIDPNLIGSMKVYKGAQLTTDVNSSTGGAITVTTLQPQDIVKEGSNFGAEIVAESRNNAVAPNRPTLHTGKRWQDVPAYESIGGVPYYTDPELRFQTRDDAEGSPFDGEDTALRLALAGIHDKFDWIIALASRDRGNYYSGENNADFYSNPIQEGGDNLVPGRNPTLQPEQVALVQRPGEEVPNTSAKLESMLAKGTVKFDDFHKLELSARYTESTHGEILASRSDYRTSDGLPQWPLANAKIEAYSIKFRGNPENRWLNYSTNLWYTKSDSRSNTGYGFPNFVNWQAEDPDIIINTSVVNRLEERYGFDFDNKMAISSQLDVTLGGSYQHHQLIPKEGLAELVEFYGGPVRAGEREEYNAIVNVEWRPTDWLIVNAGVRYGAYETIDDYVKYKLDAGESVFPEIISVGDRMTYQTLETYAPEEIAQNVANAEHEVRIGFTERQLNSDIAILQNKLLQTPDNQALRDELALKQNQLANFDTLLQEQIDQATKLARETTEYTQDHSSDWLIDANNKRSMSDNPCLKAMNQSNYIDGSCRASSINSDPDNPHSPSKEQRTSNTQYKHSDQGWMPSIGLTWLINDSQRAYARYTETLRFPSLFESTSGFSADPSPSSPVKAERAKLVELAYIHYFEQATLKLTYFDQTVDDIIDRDRLKGRFTNLNSQRTSGIEFNGQFDTGDYFGDASMAYNFENEVCDDNAAVQDFIANVRTGDNLYPSTETCVRGGFGQNSYLARQASPEYSASLLLGARFWEQKLETGIHGNFTSESHEDESISRTDVTTIDAYVKYAITPQAEVELIGTNLSNIYYLDHGSVSGMPAPGRTIGLKFKGSF